MSGFDLTELLPFYLDETDEQIGVLNDALLRLEQNPTDSAALQEAFRIVHSLKGSSSVMGFEQVKRLSHHLEALFDQLRSGSRSFDREVLDLTFQCLDRLRDFHRDLRAEGESRIDLSESISAVQSCTESPPEPGAGPSDRGRDASADSPPPEQHGDEEPRGEAEPTADRAETSPVMPTLIGPAELAITVVFEPNLQWRDMKARLVLNRLASRVRILSSDPPADRLEEVETLPSFTIRIESDADPDELRSLADADGIAEIRFDAPSSRSSERASTPREGSAPSGSDEANAPDRSLDPSASEPDPGSTPKSRPGPAPEDLARSDEATTETVAVVPASSRRPTRIPETLRVDVDRLDHLMNLAGELVINRARFSELNTGLEDLFRASNARLLAADSQDRLEFLAQGLEQLRGQARVSTNAIDRWRSQFRRLTENMQSICAELDRMRQGRDRLTAMGEAIDQLGRVCDGIQKGVLDTRMVPIGPLFERFRRVVRDLSHSSDKEIVLEIRGETTELDKRMIDELSDPLVHMVRNAVDHGLESSDRREAAGKPRTGKVTLSAAHRGNHVVITVADDGRGIDCDRIRQTVAAQGVLTRDEAIGLGPAELIPYIFHPGLSTAEQISDISGRGVGMDIVKSRIEALNGSVDVRSEPGRGTTFTIRLPLTLAIMPSLLVHIFGVVYAIPLGDIKEIVEVGPGQSIEVQGERAIEIRGQIIALIALSDVFRWGGRDAPVSVRRNQSANGGVQATRPVIVLQNARTTLGLMVDELIGMHEVVLKSIERNFREVRGLSGASILGDGRVSLILDVDAVIDLAMRRRSPLNDRHEPERQQREA